MKIGTERIHFFCSKMCSIGLSKMYYINVNDNISCTIQTKLTTI